MASVGFPLWPDLDLLPRILPVLERVDYVEVAPETLWGPDGVPNAFHRIAATLADGGLPLVAHGVAYDPASSDVDRRRTWLRRLRRDTDRLGLRWLSDHLGTTHLAGEPVALPVPAPASFARLRLALDQLADATGSPAAIENSAWYAHPGEALDEPAALGDALGDRHHLVLDLHNLWVNSLNLGFDPAAWLDRAPLDRVIELHVSGGRPAPDAWGLDRAVRLDSHDDAVPDAVWDLLDEALPRCVHLRGATLEHIEAPIPPEAIDRVLAELDRLRHTVAGVGLPLPEPASPPDALPGLHLPGPTPAEIAADRALTSLVRDPADDAGAHVAHRLIVKLRFERLLRGEHDAQAWFDADPEGFAAAFRVFHAEVPCRETPWEEARAWRMFRAGARGG